MSNLLRGLLGHVYMAEADDGTGGGGGGADTGAGGDAAGGGDGADGERGAADPGGAADDGGDASGASGDGAGKDDGVSGAGGDPKGPASMLAAITEGLAAGTEQTGKPAAKKPAEKPAGGDTAEIDPKTGKPKVAAAKAPDNPLYAMPDGLGPQARQRFQGLVEGHKKVAVELETIKGELAKVQPQYQEIVERQNAFRDILKSTNTAPEELNQFFTYKDLLKSGNLQGAADVLQEQLKHLSIRMGKPLGGNLDPLKDYPDLRTQVDEHRITEEAALELARGRLDTKAREAAAQRNATEASSQDEVKKAKATGVKNIQAWSRAMSAKDLDYKHKEPKLLEILDEVMENYPPHLWVPTLELQYKNLSLLKATKAAGNPPPLRPSGGGGKKEAGSLHEAMWGSPAP